MRVFSQSYGHEELQKSSWCC